jgi:hypothetical protein
LPWITAALCACGGGGSGPAQDLSLSFHNFQAADVVIGQPNFGAHASNQGGAPGPNTLYVPFISPAVMPDGRMFLGDFYNNRILAYGSLPTINNANADFVLGQPDFTTAIATATKRGSHGGPAQVFESAGKLVVADFDSSRVVIYDSIPTSGAAMQSVVVGQPDFTSDARACTRSSLSNPDGVAVTPDGKLIVTDSGSRVMIWNTLPSANGQPADVVLGQADFTHCMANDDDQNGAADGTPSARTLFSPTGLWTDGTRLVVSDLSNNRVLVWNAFPTRNFQPADVVLGQADFTGRAYNDDNNDSIADAAPSARTLHRPYGVGSNGVRLAVADSLNHRVLIWNSFPTHNFQAADVVLGQSDFTHQAADDDDQDGVANSNASARTFHTPGGVLFYRDKLLVTDSVNSRVLIFSMK